MLPGADWVTAPSWWQRALLGVLSVPFVVGGAAFLVPAMWAASTGQLCGLCFWYGLPTGSMGAVLLGAALMPMGGIRDSAMTVAFISLGASLALFGAIWLKLSA